MQRKINLIIYKLMYLSVFFVTLLATTCNKKAFYIKEDEEMKFIYTLKYDHEPTLWPVMAQLNDPYTDIFSVPVENAVGTNSINNAITLLRFKDDHVEYDELRRDFIDGVASGDKYYAGLFSDEWIGYTQTRGFLLFNVKNNKFSDNIPLFSGDEMFTGVVPFNGTKLQFVFQKYRAYFDDGKRSLHILEFDGHHKFQQISELQAGLHPDGFLDPWAVQNEKIFLYNSDSSSITAYDINFHKTPHTFCEIFNRWKEFRYLDQLAIHPTLPFAILVEIDKKERDNYKLWCVRWNTDDPDKQIRELLPFREPVPFKSLEDSYPFSVSNIQFSPDGSWLLFEDNSDRLQMEIPTPTFVVMPVSPDNKFPLGKAKPLGKIIRDGARVSSTAWIKEPLSFVVSDGEMLYKWEIAKVKREF